MGVEAVIFDWGGTLTPWHTVDIRIGWRKVARVLDPHRVEEVATRLLAAETALWDRTRSEHVGATLDAVFAMAELTVAEDAVAQLFAFWEPHTHTHPEVFLAALRAVEVDEPGRAVYVGDRLFEDVYGAQAVGMRAVHVTHSKIPPQQRGHTEGVPDAVVERIADLLPIIDGWRRDEGPDQAAGV